MWAGIITLLWWVLGHGVPHSYAGDARLTVRCVRAQDVAKRIPKLDACDVVIPDGSEEEYYETGKLKVEVRGRLSETVPINLILQIGEVVTQSRVASGKFAYAMRLGESEFPVILRYVHPNGAAYQERLTIVIGLAEWKALGQRREEARTPNVLGMNVAVGPTYILYGETFKIAGRSNVDYRGALLTAKAGMKIFLGESWDLGLSSYVTIVPLSTNRPDAALRFLGVNGRLGWRIPGLSDPWALWLAVGWYYTTTFVSTSGTTFGFSGMMGPQLYPTLRRSFSKGRDLYFYFKYSPISDFSTLTFASGELAAGVGSTVVRLGKVPLTLSLDFSSLWAEITDIVSIKSQSVTLSVGTGF